MKEVEILKDILAYRTASQCIYNDGIIEIRNPEVRQLFTQIRDDEMRAVERLQQIIERQETPPGIIARVFPERQKKQAGD